jgi:hypothetical protein
MEAKGKLQIKALSELIKLVGTHSVGGNSVEDIQKERERCSAQRRLISKNLLFLVSIF